MRRPASVCFLLVVETLKGEGVLWVEGKPNQARYQLDITARIVGGAERLRRTSGSIDAGSQVLRNAAGRSCVLTLDDGRELDVVLHGSSLAGCVRLEGSDLRPSSSGDGAAS